MNGQLRVECKAIGKASIMTQLPRCIIVTLVYLAINAISLQISYYYSPAMIMFTGESLIPQITLTLSNVTLYLLLLLLDFVITSPVEVGCADFYCKLIGGAAPSPKLLLVWYSQLTRVFKSIGVNIISKLFVFLWQLPFVYAPLSVIWYYVSKAQTLEEQYMAAGYVWIAVIGTIFALIMSMSYMASPFLAAGMFGKMNAWKSVRESVRIIKGHRIELFLFELSFLPWYLLAGVTFGLALLYVLPYHNASKAAYIQKLKMLKDDSSAMYLNDE